MGRGEKGAGLPCDGKWFLTPFSFPVGLETYSLRAEECNETPFETLKLLRMPPFFF